MKITFIGHASILIEAAGVTVLSDPWWRGPCFGAQWWLYPLPYLPGLDGKRLDYIYISHGHHDHFHPGTLKSLPRTAKVLVSSQLDLAPAVRELGFECIEIDRDKALRLGNEQLQVRIMPTHGDDTLMALSDGLEVCLNLNDALHSAPQLVQSSVVAQIKTLYPKIDYIFCGYGIASHFPNCYQLPGKDAKATVSLRQSYFNNQWAKIISGLAPRFGFPFAADVVFLQEELFWANEATHNCERPITTFRRRFPQSTTNVIDIAPGFQIANGEVLSLVTRTPVQSARLREELSEQIERANRVGVVVDSTIAQIVEALNSNLSHCREYLSTFPGDYRVALHFLNSPTSLLFEKKGTALSLEVASSKQARDVDLSYTTRWSYLGWALQRPYGDEILFVGSGGIFEYPNRKEASRAIHRELITLIRNRPPTTRTNPIGKHSLVRSMKQLAKRLLGRKERDLYDLLDWTVFSPPSSVDQSRRTS